MVSTGSIPNHWTSHNPIGSPITFPLKSDLFSGYLYPSFEQLGLEGCADVQWIIQNSRKIDLWENMPPTVDTKFSMLNNWKFYARKCPICYQQRLQTILPAFKCLARGFISSPLNASINILPSSLLFSMYFWTIPKLVTVSVHSEGFNLNTLDTIRRYPLCRCDKTIEIHR